MPESFEAPATGAAQTEPFDEFGLDDETASERLARELAEADLDLVDMLRQVREHRHLSQEQLGAIMGVSQATVSSFENGSFEPKLSTIRRYAHALDVMVVHAVRPLDSSLSGLFTWTTVTESVPRTRVAPVAGTYPAANNVRTDYALAG